MTSKYVIGGINKPDTEHMFSSLSWDRAGAKAYLILGNGVWAFMKDIVSEITTNQASAYDHVQQYV